MGTKSTDNKTRDNNINQFYGTQGTWSFFNQIKSIFNASSGSATVSADITSLNFRNGMQVNAVTNVQAGSSNAAPASSGSVPTLSTTSAAQATQNMLYGGTVVTAVIYPFIAYGASGLSSEGNLGFIIDFVGREGIDIQNFKAGTSTSVVSPPSHGAAQIEGYLQYNSTNLLPNSPDFSGALFLGGSYGYSYTSHGYARDYGFGNNVNNVLGQISAGIVINQVARIAVSRAFGPSQTFINSGTNTQTTVNNFKAWSFGIMYQSPPPKSGGSN